MSSNNINISLPYCTMKYYDTSFEEYIQSIEKYPFHPEVLEKIDAIPNDFSQFQNTIFYGPPGTGKYSCALSLIQKFSTTKMKYDKKISVFNEKFEKKSQKDKPGDKKKTNAVSFSRKVDFVYRLSDIHYEVDMALLGCNSKTLWNDIFFQIVDIVSVNSKKRGIILCKNAHAIYNELLDVFYSYILHPLKYYNIEIKFILLTEHLSFLPSNVRENFRIIHVKRPNVEQHVEVLKKQSRNIFGTNNFACIKDNEVNELSQNLTLLGTDAIENLKEIHLLKRGPPNELPPNVFNVIIDDIIQKMCNPDRMNLSDLRNSLYDMLIYNLDATECISYIVFHIIRQQMITEENANALLQDVYSFLKYYNKNYRPIYHLEGIVMNMMEKMHYT